MAAAKESKNWAEVLNKAGRILGLVPTHKAALSAKKKAERVTAQDDFPKTLIALAEDAEDAKRQKWHCAVSVGVRRIQGTKRCSAQEN